MIIRQASEGELDRIHHIVQNTIRSVYPKYYHEEAVEFFLGFHSLEAIKNDIEDRHVWVIEKDGSLIGTGTVLGNGISRMFVDPDRQRQGFGSKLLEELELVVSKDHASAQVDASLPAFNLYLRRGYQVLSGNELDVENQRVLFYLSMEKKFGFAQGE